MKRRHLASLAISLSMVYMPQAGAAEGPMDFLFSSNGQMPKNQGIWKYGEFSAIRLVPREEGAPPNEHPAAIKGEAVSRQLAGITYAADKGKFLPLFSHGELDAMSPDLAQALAQAGPGQDVVLVASARREGGMLSLPQSVTARIFVSQGQLQLITQEVRSDILSRFRSTHLIPGLEFGSRYRASGMQLQSQSGQLMRQDWVLLPLQSAADSGETRIQTPPERVVNPRQGETFYLEQGKRLSGLKSLREQDLLTEEEFQRKRREVIEGL